MEIKKKSIYYAHSIHLYNTIQEKRDVQFLESMGYEVLNPNRPETQEEVKNWKEKYGDALVMEYFNDLIDRCDDFCFRSHVDLKIPSGVVHEIKVAQGLGKLIFELPTITKSRFLDVEETRQYLQLNGQR